MVNQTLEHTPKVYRPEDIKYKGTEPYLTIILGQMVLELALRNVGSEEKPIWIAWFDPRVKDVKEAGTAALTEILEKIENAGMAITPFSSKSGPMVEDACTNVGIPILTLSGSRVLEDLQAEVGMDEPIYAYHPITSMDKPKFMAFGEQVAKDILDTAQRGEVIVIIDDVYSSGGTIKAMLKGLKAILGPMYEEAQIEVVTVAREGVIHNGEQLKDPDLERRLLFDVFIPEVIGNLNAGIEK